MVIVKDDKQKVAAKSVGDITLTYQDREGKSHKTSLSSVADISQSETMDIIRHTDQKRNLIIKGTVAEGYVDTGVKILIAVVIGALLLAGLYALFNTTIMPTVTKKVTDLFNYKGK